MATLQFAFRLDAEVGQKVKEESERLGISATDAFRMFAYAYVQSGGFPFPIRLNQEKNKAEPFASEAEMNDFVQAAGADMMRRFDEEEARHGAR